MSIEVAGKDSPRGRRIVWFSLGALISLIGLGAIVTTLLAVEDVTGLALSMVILIPGLLWVSTGVRVLARVSGVKPDVPVVGSGVAAFTVSAAVGLVGTCLALFFWVLSRSVWVNEGGTLDTAPNNGLVVAAVCLLATIICLALALTVASVDERLPSGEADR